MVLVPFSVGLIPAHAGKTTRKKPSPRESGAHPRSRGENNNLIERGAQIVGSSPLTRGKRSSVFNASIRVGLIPAHAGKTLLWARKLAARPAHPRSRGENVMMRW